MHGAANVASVGRITIYIGAAAVLCSPSRLLITNNLLLVASLLALIHLRWISGSTAVVNHFDMVVNLDSGGEWDGLKDAPVVVLKSTGMFFLSTLTCREYYELKSDIYKMLSSTPILRPDIEALVSAVTSSLDVGDMVGVHYREFDGDHDWSVVPPQGGLMGQPEENVWGGEGVGKREATTWGEVSVCGRGGGGMQCPNVLTPLLFASYSFSSLPSLTSFPTCVP